MRRSILKEGCALDEAKNGFRITAKKTSLGVIWHKRNELNCYDLRLRSHAVKPKQGDWKLWALLACEKDVRPVKSCHKVCAILRVEEDGGAKPNKSAILSIAAYERRCEYRDLIYAQRAESHSRGLYSGMHRYGMEEIKATIDSN